MDELSAWIGVLGEVTLANFKLDGAFRAIFGPEDVPYDETFLAADFTGSQQLDLEDGIVGPAIHLPVDPIAGLAVTRTTCDAFAESFCQSFCLTKLLNLPVFSATAEVRKRDFYIAQLHITELFTAADKAGVLHRMMLLDHVARCVERGIPRKEQQLHKIPFEYNKAKLQSAIVKYLLTHNGSFLAFVDSEIEPPSQHALMSRIINKVRTDIDALYVKHGNNKVKNSLYDQTSDFNKWWGVVSTVLLAGASSLDSVLIDNSIDESNINILYGFHMTCSANNNRDDITLQAYVEQATGQRFRKFEFVEVLANDSDVFNVRDIEVSLTPGTLVRVTEPSRKRTRTGAAVVTAPSSPAEPPSQATPLPANAMKRARNSRDIAYWVKIDPQYLLPGVSRDWCKPGMVIGIFDTGAGPASVDAQAVCVVTSQPSDLEMPQPFAGAEAEPVGLYLEIAIAVGVLGRVPVILEDEVRERFYDGKKNRLMYWAKTAENKPGRVDFEDEQNHIDYDTAKFIGEAFYDGGRFVNGKNGELKMDFQGVRAVHVFVSYRTVPQTQIQGMIKSAIGYVHKHFVTFKTFAAVALFFAVVLMCVVVAVWHLFSISHEENPTAGVPPQWLIRDALTSMLRNATLRAAWGLSLLPTSVSLFSSNTTAVDGAGALQVAWLPPPLARNYKDGTFVSVVMPPPHTNIPPAEWPNVVHTAMVASPPAAAIVVWSPRPNHKSAAVIGLVHRPEIYSSFPSGVYYLNSYHVLGQTESMLFSLGHQLFGKDLDYTNITHYPTLLNERLRAHNLSVAVVMDNVVEVSGVRAVMTAVQSVGVVVVTAREPLAIDGAVYVDTQPPVPQLEPAPGPAQPKKVPGKVSGKRSSHAASRVVEKLSAPRDITTPAISVHAPEAGFAKSILPTMVKDRAQDQGTVIPAAPVHTLSSEDRVGSADTMQTAPEDAQNEVPAPESFIFQARTGAGKSAFHAISRLAGDHTISGTATRTDTTTYDKTVHQPESAAAKTALTTPQDTTSDPISPPEEKTHSFVVDNWGGQITYNGGEEDRFSNNVNKVVREAGRIKEQWKQVKGIFGVEL